MDIFLLQHAVKAELEKLLNVVNIPNVQVYGDEGNKDKKIESQPSSKKRQITTYIAAIEQTSIRGSTCSLSLD